MSDPNPGLATGVPTAGADAPISGRPATTADHSATFRRGHGAGTTGVDDAELDRLAERAGIDLIWWDVDGGYHKVSADTKQVLLAAMRLPAATQADLRDSLARFTVKPTLPPALTVRRPDSIRLRFGGPRA